MKKFLVVAIAVMGFAAPTANAADDASVALQNICAITAADDKSQLRKKMRTVKSDYRLSLGDWYDGVTCGGKKLLEHADANGSADVLDLMIKRMPRKLAERELNNWTGSQLGRKALEDRVG